MENIAYLSLGSNMGDRKENIQKAIEALCSSGKVKLTNFSSIYETDPVGYTDQDPFLNMVIEVATTLSPWDLLNLCLEVERELGRKRIIRWGPRTIDLDILLYNNENIKTEHLKIPHPRMKERAFVLVPLAEIKPELILPDEISTVQKMANEIPNKGVRLWSLKNGEDVSGLFEN